MKKTISNKLTRPASAFVILFLFIHAASAQSNFTGNWKRNDEQSNANGLSINSIPVTLEINQDDHTFTIKRISKNGAGVVTTYSEVLKLDGSSSETITPAKLHRNATIRWSVDKAKLTESFVSKDDQGNVMQSGTQVFTLDNNGKTLKVKAAQNYDGADAQFDEVFDKE